MYQLLGTVKENLKKSRTIVILYEAVVGGCKKIYRIALKKYRILKTRLTMKTHFCYGDKNKDKTFFVISCNTKEMGLYSAVLYVLPFIDYAVKKKYIPIIDFKRAYLPNLQDKDKIGIENPWEYYYEQPVKPYTLEEVYQSENVIIKVDEAYGFRKPDWNSMFPTDEKELKYWNRMIKSYIRLNSELENAVESEREKIFKANDKILGVGIRAGLRAGSMRNEALYNDHPKQPTCEELMDIAEGKMKEWNCDAMFLSCDDREYLNKFIARFGNRCCYTDRKRVHFFKNDSPVLEIAELNSEYVESTVLEKTKEYIVEVYLLAQCNCLYSCIGGGAEFAYFLNGGQYEHLEVYDKGLYGGLGEVK